MSGRAHGRLEAIGNLVRTPMPRGLLVAEVRDEFGNPHSDEAKARAALFAAAPDMLEVLARYVQQDLAQGLTDNNLHRTARAAIAKATGSAS